MCIYMVYTQSFLFSVSQFLPGHWVFPVLKPKYGNMTRIKPSAQIQGTRWHKQHSQETAL